MNKIFTSLQIIATLITITSCAVTTSKTGDGTPSWYISNTQNNSENLYGVGEGFTLEEATKYALVDAASRLMVRISSESTLLREENKSDFNEELRQKISQRVEQINFANFKVSRSAKSQQKIFIEVKIERDPFIKSQKDDLRFLEKKILNLDKNSIGKNSIQRRNSLIKILDLSKEVDLKSRILTGAGQNINLEKKLSRIADFENKLAKVSDKAEFYFDTRSNKSIARIIRNDLNKKQLKVTSKYRAQDSNQILIKIRSSNITKEVYGAFITKIKIDFENKSSGKTLASSSIEVSGSSTINKTESYSSALKSLENKVSKEGALKIIGITN